MSPAVELGIAVTCFATGALLITRVLLEIALEFGDGWIRACRDLIAKVTRRNDCTRGASTRGDLR